jgi:hypothetical protein
MRFLAIKEETIGFAFMNYSFHYGVKSSLALGETVLPGARLHAFRNNQCPTVAEDPAQRGILRTRDW